MKLNSSPFFATKKNAISDGTEAHKLLIQAGLIDMVGSGLYTWLPLGLRVLNKISTIIREELHTAGCQELLFPTMQPGSLWEESGRLTNAYKGEKLTIKDRADRILVYGPTAEEVATDLFRKHIQSYKQLPLVIYNIQWKFRDEIRPRFGIKRAREFLMLDAYSFGQSVTQEQETYKYILDVFQKILKRFGLNAVAALADSGEIGGDLSHELVVEGENGEATLGFLKDGRAVMLEGEANTEVVTEINGTEVGHTFYLGDTYSSKMNAAVAGQDGTKVTVQMGCYGIGVSRLLGVIAENLIKDNKLHWSTIKRNNMNFSIAPYDIVLITMTETELTNSIYEQLSNVGYDVLIDSRDISLGERLNDAELVGIPLRIPIGNKESSTGKLQIKYGINKSADSLLEDMLESVSRIFTEL